MAGTGISPAIEAIALAAEGHPIPENLISAEDLKSIFRCGRAGLTGISPRVVVVGAGRRGGKTSNLLAPRAVHAAWVTPVPTLKKGEIARSVIISPDTDQSGACFDYCRGIVESSPVLSNAVVKITTEQILLRRPDGTKVEIVVGAASRGGKAARSRSVLFCGLDEAAFFFPDGSHVANDTDIYAAVLGTIKFLVGAQIWIVSTPWIEGVGVMEKLIEEHWGSPGFALVAARVSSYLLRGIPDDDSLREGMDDDTYNREIQAKPLPEGSVGFFPMARVIEAEKRENDAPIVERGAGADLGFLKDSSALVIASKRSKGGFSVDHLEEYSPEPGKPLKPTVVCRQFADTLEEYGIRAVSADNHEKATALEIFGARDITLIPAPALRDDKEKVYRAARTLFEEGAISFWDLPEGDRVNLRNQLRMIVSKPRPGGGYEISAPRATTKQDLAKQGKSIKGHADAVSAFVLALWQAGSGSPDALKLTEAIPDMDDFEDNSYEQILDRGIDRLDDLRWRD